MNLSPAYLLFSYLQLMQFDLHKAMMCNKLKTKTAAITGRWLDVGAGDQPYRKYFASVSEYLTTNTKRHYGQQISGHLDKLTTYWIEDGKQLPLPDNSLDGVACFQVLSVIDKPNDFFREIHRVLKPGGMLILTTDFLYPVWSKEDIYRHTANGLRKMASENGFEATSIESFGGFGSLVYMLVMRYLRSFPGLWKRKNLLVKILSAVIYLIALILLPIISLKGMIIFQIEKNLRQNTDFTFNLMMTATTTADKA